MPALSEIIGVALTSSGGASSTELTVLKKEISDIKAELLLLKQDKELPRMILLDEVEDITMEGQHEISMRVYIDD